MNTENDAAWVWTWHHNFLILVKQMNSAADTDSHQTKDEWPCRNLSGSLGVVIRIYALWWVTTQNEWKVNMFVVASGEPWGTCGFFSDWNVLQKIPRTPSKWWLNMYMYDIVFNL